MRRHLLKALLAVAVLSLSGAVYSFSTFARWASVPVTFYINPANVDVTPGAALTAMQAGMNVWNGAGGSGFSFQYGGAVTDTATALDNRNVAFFRNVSNGSVIATTYSWWDNDGHLLDSDIIFWDGGFTFFTGTSGCGGPSAAYIEDIAAHEFGHALGLGHSTFSNATMFASYSICSQAFRSLAADDIAGVNALYPGAVNTPPTVSITGPTPGASAVAPASFTVAADALDAEGPVGNVAFYANAVLIAQDDTSPFSVSWNNVAAGNYALTAVATDGGGLSTTSAAVNVTVTTPSPGVNVASAAQGATVTASSGFASNYPASAVIDGNRRGVYGGGGVWVDNTGHAYPDSVEIAFAGSRTIDQVAVFSMQDAWNAPSEPTPAMTWSLYGVNDFTIQFWNGSDWQAVPNGVVRNNNLVWRTVTFAPLTTTRIRILVERAADGWTRLTEVEAYQSAGAANTPPTVSITNPTAGATGVAPANFTVAADAFDAEGPVSTVAFYANGGLIAHDNTSPFSVPWTNVAAGSYTLTAVATDGGGLTGTSASVVVTVTPGGSVRVNVAAAAQGGTVTASTTFGGGYPASAVIDGNRRGAYGGGGVWLDSTGGVYPDWVEIVFAGSRTIDQVSVFTMQDAWSAPVEPTPSMTWSLYGVHDFTVQFWNGSSWQAVPNGVVRNNNLVWRDVTFAALTTTRIRVLAERAADGWTRLTEVEVFQSSGAANTAPTVNITSPAAGATAIAPASFTVAADAVDIEGPISSVAFYANGGLIAQDNTSPFSVLWNNVAAGSYTLTAVATDAGGLTGTSAAVIVTVTASGGVNVAAAAQGATVTASSSFGGSYPASAVIDGNRRGVYAGGGVWLDGTGHAYPDSVEITFAGSRNIDQVAVFTMQDAWNAPAEPTSSMTWSLYGVADFTVQFWNGSGWQTVPNGVVRNNNLVWRTLSFAPLTTTRIRVLVERGADGWSRLTEVEAYQVP